MARRGGPGEALFEIPDQVVDRFGADRQPDGSRPDARRPELIIVELPMRRARRMDDQALRVADVGEVRPQRDAADEVLPAGAAAAAVEREHRAGAARQILVDQRPVAARRQGGVGHVRRQGVRREVTRHGAGVLDMPRHPQRQRLEPLQEQEGVERAHRRTEVAQGLGAQLHQVAVGAEGLVELQARGTPATARRPPESGRWTS